MTDPQDLLRLADALSDYGVCLDPNVVICDRRIVDEVIAVLVARAHSTKDSRNVG